MSKKTPYLLGILFSIILGTVLYYFLCCNCYNKELTEYKENESKEKVVSEIKKATRNAFVIADANIDENDNFNFKTSNFSILNPVSESVTSSVLKLKDFLLEQPLKIVDISGFYKSDELNNSAYPNLGIARANAVKNYLVSQGISSKQINTKGQLNDEIYPDESSTLFGPLDFGILKVNPSNNSAMDALKEACSKLKADPLVLHFKRGQAAIDLTTEQRQKIAGISRCVDKMGVKVQVVGHTDNTGDASMNLVLGQQRADFVKSYLIRNGILSNNIEAISKGQTESIADNDTEEGKTINRRTIITIN